MSSKTVKEYFSILEETMLGFYLKPFTKTIKRKVIQSPKFYFFDVAIPNHLMGKIPLQKGTDYYGHALEHFVIQELRAFLSYNDSERQISFWHTSDNRYEVDLVIGNAEVAIEIKATTNVKSNDTKGLKAFGEEYPKAKLIMVAQEEMPRKLNGIEIWPVCQFLQKVWSDNSFLF